MASTSWFVSEIVTFSQHRGVFLSGVTYGSVPIQAELNGKINNPTAPEYVHFFFSMLAFVSDHILTKAPISCDASASGGLSFSVPGGPSLSRGSANDHCDASADSRMCPTAE